MNWHKWHFKKDVIYLNISWQVGVNLLDKSSKDNSLQLETSRSYKNQTSTSL